MELFQLNDLMGQALGRTMSGQPKFQWCHTAGLWWWSQKSGFAARKLPSGIWVCGGHYERRSYAEPQLLGPGWTVAKWWPPDMSEQDWAAKYLGQLPYPAGGEYRAVGAMFQVHHPTEEDTLRAIHCIKADITRSYEQHVEDGDKILAARTKKADAIVEAELDEILPDYEPGVRGGPRLVFTERAA